MMIGASPSSTYANYSASKIVQPELYQTPRQYTSITPVLKKLNWLPVKQSTVFKTATLDYKFFHTGFPRNFAPSLSSYSSSYSSRCGQVVVISLSFQSSTLLFINLSNSLVIVLRLMLPLFGMLFLMRFVPLPTCTPKYSHLSLDHPLAFSVVLDPSSVSGYLKVVECCFGFVAA